MNIPRLLRLLESLPVLDNRAEYWITPNGLLFAGEGSDYNHEAHVYELLCAAVREAAGMEPVENDDATTLRTELWDFFDGHEDPDAAVEAVWKSLDAQYGPEGGELARNLLSGGSDPYGKSYDARAFAVRYWNWIRVQANQAEARDLRPANLRRIASGMYDILEEVAPEVFEDGDEEAKNFVVEISIYGRSGRYESTLGALERGEVDGGSATAADVQAAARAAVDQMDKAIMTPYYKGQSGG